MSGELRRAICCLKDDVTALAQTVAATPGSMPVQVDVTYLAKYDLAGQNANPAGVVPASLATVIREDSVFSAGVYTPNGATNIVRVYAELGFHDLADANIATQQRISPVALIYKNGARVSVGATGYQRHASNHDDSSLHPAYVDENPQAGDVYEVRFERGANQTEVKNVDTGFFMLEAVEKMTVLAPA